MAVAAVAVGIAFATSDGDGGSTARPQSEPVQLGFLYSTDTADLLEPFIEEFNGAGLEVAGRRIVVEGRAIPSGQAETAISEQRVKPVIWGPASSLWGRLLNHHVDGTWVANQNPSLVRSPQVIAMWEPLARALGWPEAAIGWTDILALATSPAGWGSVGRPHFGTFKLGHTNPNSSTSGLSAVAAMYYAIGEGLTPDDVARPRVRKAVREIERAIVHYGETAGDFLDQMARYGPDYAHAVAVQETSLVQFNAENKGAKLVAIYPAEGTFVADYPLIVLRAPWVDEAERAGAELFNEWLSPRITPELAARYAYRAPDTHRILSPVDGAHGADPAQPEAVLQAPVPDVLAAVQQNWNEDRKPANVMLVVDTSGSMGQRGRLARAQAALEAFLDDLRTEDRVGLVTFGSDVFRPVDIAPLRDNESELRETIGDLIPSGKAAVYDAVREGFAAVRALEDETRINAVIVLADGVDDASTTTLDELEAELSLGCAPEESAVPVITVAYGAGADRDALGQIAAACQGRALTAERNDVEDVFRTIALLF